MKVVVRFGLVCALVASALVAQVHNEAPAAAATAAPAVQVQANRLVDSATGATFVPRGVNIPGLEYSCVQGWRKLPAAGEFAALASWKINTVRLPLNESCWLGLDGAPAGSTVTQYRADVAAWVNGANAAGLVVILDLHWNAPAGYTASGQRAMPDERSGDFWSSVATTYASNASVMFELFNEPYSRAGFTLTWACWKNGGCLAPVENDSTATLSGATYVVTGMQDLVTAVRATGATQPILLGGLNYSNDLTGWLANIPSDPANQLVAAWHNYPGQGCSTSCWNSTIASLAASVPIVTTEFGNTAETTSTSAGNGGNYLVPFMTWAEAHGIGYLPWAWWDVSSTDSVPNSVYALYTGAGFTPKSPSGTKFHSYLAALTPPAPQPLAAGTLVKTSTASTVYLVDGSSRLVPLAAFSSAADAGFSTTYTTVAPSLLDTYTVAGSRLTNVVVCGSTRYLAADGKLWPLAPSMLSSLPATTLDPQTCAVPPAGPTVLASTILLTPTAGGKIYALDATGRKRFVPSIETAASISAPEPVRLLRVGNHFLGTLQNAGAMLPAGRLVKSSASPTVYLADGFDRLIPISSFSTATDAGISTAYLTLSSTDLAGAQIDSTPLRNTISCAGSTYFAGSGSLWPVASDVVSGLPITALGAETCQTLRKSTTELGAIIARSPSSPVLYAVSGGSKLRISSMLSVSILNAPQAATWLTVSDHFLASLPIGESVLSPGMLVKGSTPSIYMVADDSTLLFVRSFASVADLGLSSGYTTVANSRLLPFTVASNSLGNVVSCNDSTFLASGGRLHEITSAAFGQLPISPLDDRLCDLLVLAPSAPPAVFVKSPNAKTIYLLTNGTKRPVASWQSLVSLANGSPVVFYTTQETWLSTVPTGPVISSS